MCASRSVLHSLARTFTQRERERKAPPIWSFEREISVVSLSVCVSLCARLSVAWHERVFKTFKEWRERLCGPPLKSLLLLFVCSRKDFFSKHTNTGRFSPPTCVFLVHKSIISGRMRVRCAPLYFYLSSQRSSFFTRVVFWWEEREKSRSLGERPEQCRARVYNALRIHTRRRNAFLKRERESRVGCLPFFLLLLLLWVFACKSCLFSASPKKETQKDEQKKNKKKRKRQRIKNVRTDDRGFQRRLGRKSSRMYTFARNRTPFCRVLAQWRMIFSFVWKANKIRGGVHNLKKKGD